MAIEHEYQYRTLRPSQIKVDPYYQRIINNNRVAKIVKEWEPDLVNALKVSQRDGGEFYVFDGQHTLTAWKKVNGDKPIMCKIYLGLTWIDEMNLFLKQNGIESDPTTNDKLKALFNSRDPEVMDMVNAAAKAGVTMDFGKVGSYSKTIAGAAMFESYKMVGSAMFTKSLKILMDAFDGDPKSLTGGFIRGITTLVYRLDGQFTHKKMVDGIAKYSPDWYIREAKTKSGRVGERYAKAFLAAYNNKKQHKLFLD